MTKHERITPGGPLPMLCSVARVARELDCSKSKVYKMINEGKLSTITIDGMVRVKREEVETLCQAMISGSGSTGASTSPSEDTVFTSADIRSASRLGRLARLKPSARSAS